MAGEAPHGFHAGNLLLHGAVCALAWFAAQGVKRPAGFLRMLTPGFEEPSPGQGAPELASGQARGTLSRGPRGE